MKKKEKIAFFNLIKEAKKLKNLAANFHWRNTWMEVISLFKMMNFYCKIHRMPGRELFSEETGVGKTEGKSEEFQYFIDKIFEYRYNNITNYDIDKIGYSSRLMKEMNADSLESAVGKVLSIQKNLSFVEVRFPIETFKGYSDDFWNLEDFLLKKEDEYILFIPLNKKIMTKEFRNILFWVLLYLTLIPANWDLADDIYCYMLDNKMNSFDNLKKIDLIMKRKLNEIGVEAPVLGKKKKLKI